MQWIPRSKNEKADHISRLIDFDDWQITPELFRLLEDLWGPHIVHCFANFYTAKLPRFFSRFWDPGTSGIDFSAQSLESENFLVVPPVHLVARAVHYLHLQMARATIVVPGFWPLITNKYKQFIKGYLVRNGRAEALCRQGRDLNPFLGSDEFIGKVIAVRLEHVG